ncbi:hypothetical protein [Burkholderia sp. SIMBA_019]
MVTTAGVVLTSACTQQPYDPAWLSKQWAMSMNTYNIKPIYPPTEDVHVGDVYGLATDPYGSKAPPHDRYGGELWASVKLAYVPMNRELEDYYSALPVFPETTDPPSNNAIWRQQEAGALVKIGNAEPASDSQTLAPKSLNEKTKKAQAPSAAGVVARDATPPPRSVFAPTKVLTKLPLVAFPGFTLARGNLQSFGTSVPLRFFNIVFGASHSNDDKVTISVRGAETYGILSSDAKLALYNFCHDDNTGPICDHRYVESELATLTGDAGPKYSAVAMVTRLYLARSIDYTYENASATDASGSVSVLLAKAVSNQQALLGLLAAGSGKAASGNGGSQPADAKKAALPSMAGSSPDAASAPQETSAPTGASVPVATDKQNHGDTQSIQSQVASLLASLQTLNQSLGSSAVPGSTFSIGSISERGITLVQTFERPIAVGYRYVAMRSIGGLDPDTDHAPANQAK